MIVYKMYVNIDLSSHEVKVDSFILVEFYVIMNNI